MTRTEKMIRLENMEKALFFKDNYTFEDSMRMFRVRTMMKRFENGEDFDIDEEMNREPECTLPF